jgi:predicted acylesterase/phospholipase RssA
LKNKDLKIGLAFSGGGFRASSFSLGVLSFLNEVKIGDSNLLSKVYALSTISGGTITGARYALGIKNKEPFNHIYWSIYDFMAETDLVNLSLNNLISKREDEDSRTKSLITAFADVYDKLLFDKGKFGTILSESNPVHLKHISFNATEFNNALQFRFQQTEKIKNTKAGEPDKGIIGNNYYRLPEDIAKEIRLADILASSSCFPGGFEPINFPSDFALPENIKLSEYFDEDKFPVGLMDGGIVDNQGIEPLLLTEQRMKKDNEDKAKTEENEFDLLIISDVTSPYMEGFKKSNARKLNFWRRLNLKRLIISNLLILASSVIGIIYSLNRNIETLSVLFTAIITLSLLLYFILAFIRKLPLSFQVPEAFLKPFRKLLKVKFSVYENMILNRSNSLLMMTSEVFLKHIRRLNYNKIYQDSSWKNRRIMNAIYELRTEEERLQTKIKSGKLSEELVPSSAIQKVASIASAMGTTLWFTKDELEEKDMLNSIIACGQFTMCWNLLEYIQKIKNNSVNTNERHLELLKLEEQLMDFWNKFKDEPFWLVNSIKR